MKVLSWIFLIFMTILALPMTSCGPTEKEKAIDKLEAREIYPEDYEQELWRAIDSNRSGTVRLLIRAGLDINSMRDAEFQASPLIMSIIRKKPDVARELIRSGALINEVNKYGNTALGDAFYHQQYELIDELLRAGADVKHIEQNQDTMLIIAARHGQRKYVKLFLKKGLDINAKNERGESALSAALKAKHWDVVRELETAGADTTEVDMSDV